MIHIDEAPDFAVAGVFQSQRCKTFVPTQNATIKKPKG